MPLIRHLLRNDVLTAIKSSMASGVWKDTLPSERQLSDQFQVSRGTIRYALKNLQEEGYLKSVAGSGYFIIKNIDPMLPEPTSVSIGVLIGSPYTHTGSRDQRWISTLQQRFAKRGWHIHIHDGIPEINRSPTIGLKKLFKATNHSCWLLVRCAREVQRFFQNGNIPAIICGTPYPDIELPSIDTNYRATGRHAAGILASKGHHRMGFVCRRNEFPGDAELFEGFKEGVNESPSHPSLKKIRYSQNHQDFQALLNQVKQSKNPITGIFVDSPFRYLSIFTQAIQMGIRVPQDLSMISRHDSDFLNFLSPIPACYQFDAKEMANKIHRELESRIQGDTMKRKRTLLISEYIPGGSVDGLRSID